MKVLIYMSESDIKPVGGPKGYIWNILQEINKGNVDGDVKISFLPPRNLTKCGIKNKIFSLYEVFTGNTPYVRNVKRIVSSESNTPAIELSQYDVVHFHSTYSLYMVRDALEKYKGKVLLTSHSPKALHKEYIEDCMTKKEIKKCGKIIEKISVMDQYAFDRADIIVFPCEEAEEPYYHSWKDYSNIHENNKEKYRYILSGIQKQIAKNSRNAIRKQYGIPEDAFLVSYVGRHNETKGYDYLKKVGDCLLKESENIYFIIAGKEGPLFGLQNDKWIECGWTDDAASIMAASDVFFLPNRETYFDLIMLEVLSLGIPVIATKTGGNKYFMKLDSTGIYFVDYGDVEMAKSAIQMISSVSADKQNEMKRDNLKLFDTFFTTEVFYKKYIEMLKMI